MKVKYHLPFTLRLANAKNSSTHFVTITCNSTGLPTPGTNVRI